VNFIAESAAADARAHDEEASQFDETWPSEFYGADWGRTQRAAIEQGAAREMGAE
jgi:hypothetical protein